MIIEEKTPLFLIAGVLKVDARFGTQHGDENLRLAYSEDHLFQLLDMYVTFKVYSMGGEYKDYSQLISKKIMWEKSKQYSAERAEYERLKQIFEPNTIKL